MTTSLKTFSEGLRVVRKEAAEIRNERPSAPIATPAEMFFCRPGMRARTVAARSGNTGTSQRLLTRSFKVY